MAEKTNKHSSKFITTHAIDKYYYEVAHENEKKKKNSNPNENYTFKLKEFQQPKSVCTFSHSEHERQDEMNEKKNEEECDLEDAWSNFPRVNSTVWILFSSPSVYLVFSLKLFVVQVVNLCAIACRLRRRRLLWQHDHYTASQMTTADSSRNQWKKTCVNLNSDSIMWKSLRKKSVVVVADVKKRHNCTLVVEWRW